MSTTGPVNWNKVGALATIWLGCAGLALPIVIAVLGWMFWMHADKRGEQVNNLKEEKSNAVEQAKLAEQKANNAESDKSRLAQDLAAVTRERDQLREEVKELTTDLEEKSDALASAEAKVADLERRLDAEAVSRARLQNQLDNALANLQSANRDKDALRRALEGSAAAFAKEESVSDGLRRQLGDSERSLEDEMWDNLVKTAGLAECASRLSQNKEFGCIDEVAAKLSPYRRQFHDCLVQGRGSPMYVRGMVSGSNAVSLRRGSVVLCDPTLADAEP